MGTAAGITLTPAVFIAYLLLAGRVRTGLTALAAFAGTALLGLLVFPQASAEFWTRLLSATGRALLPDWPPLWVWCVPLLAYLARTVRLAHREHRARRAPAHDEMPGEMPGEVSGEAQERVPCPRSVFGEEDVRVVEDPQHHEQQTPARHHVLRHDL